MLGAERTFVRRQHRNAGADALGARARREELGAAGAPAARADTGSQPPRDTSPTRAIGG